MLLIRITLALFLVYLSAADPISLDRYHSHETINQWLAYLHRQYPGSTEIFTYPNGSYHKRDMKVLKIGKPSEQPKNAVWIDCGIHAREWVAPATCLYIIDQLLTNGTTDSKYQDYLERLDVYVLPVVNPDGYEYSRRPGRRRRMWRKSRSECRPWADSCCGVDQNRNWKHSFGGAGSSGYVCADDYRGDDYFSESEVQQTVDFVLQRRDRFKAFLTLHSWGKYFLFPWGHKRNTYPDNTIRDLRRLGRAAAAASNAVMVDKVKTTNVKTGIYEYSRYGTGSSADVFGKRVLFPCKCVYRYAVPYDIISCPASGASDDWAHSIGIKYAYTVELSQTCHNKLVYFKMPPSCIRQSAKEAWAGIQVIFDRVIHEYTVV